MGDLEFKETGPRTGVYAEKSMLKAAAKEFADTESMIQASEKMFGPYRWTRYDILVMPPSFPVGGMENPRLSFITPTVIAGDKSLVSVIAHELAHSWSGNLVRQCDLARLLAQRGIHGLYGEPHHECGVRRAARRHGGACSDSGPCVTTWRASNPADQVLAIDLRDRDPELGFSSVPYEKGRLFLNYLDAKFGRDQFDAFLRGYFDHFAFKSITTEQFIAVPAARICSTAFPASSRARKFIAWDERSRHSRRCGVAGHRAPVSPVDDGAGRVARAASCSRRNSARVGWRSNGCIFSTTCRADLSARRNWRSLDQAYGFTRSANAEIGHSWLKLVIRNNYQPGYVASRGVLEDHRPPQADRSAVQPT